MKLKQQTKTIISIFFIVSASMNLFAERPIISSLNATLDSNGKVSITWQLPSSPDIPIVSLLLYRDTKPITTYKNLEKLSPIASFSPSVNSYTDTLPDFLSYFYAVLIATKNGTYEILLPSINTTVIGVQRTAQIQPAEIPAEPVDIEKLYPEGVLRETPLPPILISNPSQKNISREAKTQALSLLENDPPHKKEALTPFIFEQDYFAPNAGDSYILFDTLRRTFAQRNYTEAIEQLEILTGTNLEKDVVLRGTFYLGESYYFTGDFVNAVRCFLTTSERYPELSKKWIDYALDLIN